MRECDISDKDKLSEGEDEGVSRTPQDPMGYYGYIHKRTLPAVSEEGVKTYLSGQLLFQASAPGRSTSKEYTFCSKVKPASGSRS